MAAIDEFRSAKDHMFSHDPETPIAAEELAGFRGLSYFAPDPALVVSGHIEPSALDGPLLMPTSTGEEVTYLRYGVAHFTVDGTPAQLTLFASESDRDLFVPFRDSTSGKETYGAGRYLEVTRPHDHDAMVELDFNYAYNPYCAYSEAYSCPLPPLENWLKVPIRAGEKVYEGSSQHGE